MTIDSAIVRLARIVKVEGYGRRGDKGNTERVSNYVRKQLDAAGFGADKLKKGVFSGGGSRSISPATQPAAKRTASAPAAAKKTAAPKPTEAAVKRAAAKKVADRQKLAAKKVADRQKLAAKTVADRQKAAAAKKVAAKKAATKAAAPKTGIISPAEKLKIAKELKAHPIGAQNVIDAYRGATPGEKVTGANWYPNANKIANIMAEKYGVDVRTAAGIMANYSPQKAWGQNLIEANEVLRTNTPVGGKGANVSIVRKPDDLQDTRVGVMATQMQADRAAKLLDGAEFNDVFSKKNKSGNYEPRGLKIRAFAELIAKGSQSDPENPRVVVDRHAAGIARGIRMTDKGYNVDGPSSTAGKFAEYAKAYFEAAKQLSSDEGRTVTPEEVQAVTWLARQRLNLDLVASRKKLGQQDVDNSSNYFASYDPDIADILSDPMVGYAQLQDRLLKADAADRKVELAAGGADDRLVDKIMTVDGRLVTWR